MGGKSVRLHELGNVRTRLPATVKDLIHTQVNVRILEDFLDSA